MNATCVAERNLPATLVFAAQQGHVAINEEWCNIS
jgi:hypothetical protein